MVVQLTRLRKMWVTRRGLRRYWGPERTTLRIEANQILTIEEAPDAEDFRFTDDVSLLTPKGGEPFHVEGRAEDISERVNQLLEPKAPSELPTSRPQRKITFKE